MEKENREIINSMAAHRWFTEVINFLRALDTTPLSEIPNVNVYA
jgi:hypothetical protein